jgi:hypothetical protein
MELDEDFNEVYSLLLISGNGKKDDVSFADASSGRNVLVETNDDVDDIQVNKLRTEASLNETGLEAPYEFDSDLMVKADDNSFNGLVEAELFSDPTSVLLDLSGDESSERSPTVSTCKAFADASIMSSSFRLVSTLKIDASIKSSACAESPAAGRSVDSQAFGAENTPLLIKARYTQNESSPVECQCLINEPVIRNLSPKKSQGNLNNSNDEVRSPKDICNSPSVVKSTEIPTSAASLSLSSRKSTKKNANSGDNKIVTPTKPVSSRLTSWTQSFARKLKLSPRGVCDLPINYARSTILDDLFQARLSDVLRPIHRAGFKCRAVRKRMQCAIKDGRRRERVNESISTGHYQSSQKRYLTRNIVCDTRSRNMKRSKVASKGVDNVTIVAPDGRAVVSVITPTNVPSNSDISIDVQAEVGQNHCAQLQFSVEDFI